ncbi:tropomyosin, putative [Perkinsus marinus ATCC 50983]|uniref:Tropomyosin, putative n=1 Tax=Perkinsus marinus (strain ATCC 50983 / TXsc) TaxID=423536 RepID=C5L6Q1_PERM5|nr:tropomyosin, putative [Perkinsus marinus ATCC 50983]EER07593.1 tropomyosin, putative [Perkinsus marinus ATCC 50983]|eukprot:XP_002775777.1 tropomyosin, putative [Perkinsus marinus ATCC 50983]
MASTAHNATRSSPRQQGPQGEGVEAYSDPQSAQDWRNEELQDMQMKLESAMERLNRESTLADQLRAALSNKEGEAEQLQQTVKMLQAENSRLNSSSTDDDDGSVKKLRNRIEEQEAKITALQSALEEAHAAKEVSVSSGQQQEEYQGLREELGRLQESVERYQAELQRREVENKELQGELADAKRADDEQRSELSSRVESAEKMVSELREELQRAHEDEAATVGKYEARIEELERANSPKRGDVSSMASSYEVVDLDPNTMEHPGDTQLEEAARMAEEDNVSRVFASWDMGRFRRL